MKIVGVELAGGVFDGKKWQNYRIYCEGESQGVTGVKTAFYKMSMADVQDMCNDYEVSDPASLIGMTIKKLYYNRYGGVSMMELE